MQEVTAKMKYGQIAGNRSINAMIYYCFEYIHEQDVLKFIKGFREQPHDGNQVMHTFRELILGAYLVSNGFKARYDWPVGEKTPDWCILDEESVLGAVVELTNFHSAKVIENDIEKQKKTKGMASYWPGCNDDRLYHCLWRKADTYRKAVSELQVPYVIAVFGEFTAVVDKEELKACLFDAESGLFGLYEELSGVLFFEESDGQYAFSYMRNPGALREYSVPTGVFSSR